MNRSRETYGRVKKEPKLRREPKPGQTRSASRKRKANNRILHHFAMLARTSVVKLAERARCARPDSGGGGAQLPTPTGVGRAQRAPTTPRGAGRRSAPYYRPRGSGRRARPYQRGPGDYCRPSPP